MEGPFSKISYEKLVEMTVELFGPKWGKQIARVLVIALIVAGVIVPLSFAAWVSHKAWEAWFSDKPIVHSAMPVASSAPAAPVSPDSSVPAKPPSSAPPVHKSKKQRNTPRQPAESTRPSVVQSGCNIEGGANNGTSQTCNFSSPAPPIVIRND